MLEFYRQKSEHIAKEMDVKESEGLSAAEAQKRLEKYGLNALAEGRKINPFKLFLSQFNDVLIIVLLIAAAVSFGLSLVEEHGSATEAILIFAIVIAIAAIGFFNEYKAEKTVEALTKLIGSTARVRRNGTVHEIPTEQIVPGDVVLFEEGAKVPADVRLLKVNSLGVNEASLTGESLPVIKNTFAIGKKVSLGDQKNMLFSGTIVTVGTGEGIAVATGNSTQIGQIASLVSKVEDELTPMQKKLDTLGRKIGAIVLAISLLVFVVIFFLDKDLQDETTIQRLVLAFTAAVALAVAAIPEGLAFVVRISLALGARRMAEKNALVRRLSAVEALGSTDVICSDKTGTLTRGEMTVRKIYFSGKTYSVTGRGYSHEGQFRSGEKDTDSQTFIPLLQIGLMNNNSHVHDEKVIGDPTEGALVVSALKAGLNEHDIHEDFPRIAEIPFSSDRKMMSTVHRAGRSYYIASKGATTVLLRKCDHILLNNKVVKLTPKLKKQVLAEDSRMASDALRVLGFAYKESKTQPHGDKSIESKLIFAGLQGMMDPPRKEVKEVMHRVTAEAGMRVVMITGDHILTAKAVAKEIGIEGEAISGVDLEKLSQGEFEKRVEKISIYARVNPEHKIRIVKALKKHGHQVAMTGDGVNDSPAIKAADIGIAMGITGTDAAKEASDLILLDDQFLTIIDAIEEGRGIFDNVRKFVNYLLSANIAEVLTILGGVVLLGRLVLSAAQLLFINIVTDGLPAIALGSDPAEKDVMRFKPQRFQGSIINKRIWVEMLVFGSFMSAAILLHFWWIESSSGDLVRAVSVAFAATVVYEMARLVDIRSGYRIKWFSNPWLSVAIAASLGLLLAVLYIPALAEIFSVGPLTTGDWTIIVATSLLLIGLMKIFGKFLDNYLGVVHPKS